MEKKKIAFHLIKAFTTDDRNAFRQKIKCGKTAKNGERLEKLYSSFEKAIELDSLDEIKVLKLARILKLSSPKKLTPYYTELIKDLKSYLIHSELNKNKLQQKILLQNALTSRQEKVYIDVLHETIRNEVLDIDQYSAEYYQNLATFYNNLYIHTPPKTNIQQGESLIYLNLSENNLDTAYWIRKLRLLIDKANRGLVISNEKYLLEQLIELPDLTQYNHNNEAHLLSIYAKVYQFALTPFQQNELNLVLTLIKEHALVIEKEDKERIFNFLINIISYYIPSQKTDLSSSNIYEVYKLAFTNLWLVQDSGVIIFEDFMNMIYAASSYEDINLLESISSEFTKYIPDGYEPFINMLSKAHNFFLHKKWEAVLNTFTNQELPNIEHRFHYIARRNGLEIKCLFEALIHEKIELDDIPSYLEKYQRFLQRKSEVISIQAKDRPLELIKYLRRLYPILCKRITFGYDKKEAAQDLTAWLEEIEEKGTKVSESQWLKSIGQTLLSEVQQSSEPNTY